MDAHEVVVRSALRAGDEIDRLIARLGTAEHPRGAVLVAYRNAERGLRDALAQPYSQGAVSEVLRGLRRDVGVTAQETLQDAQTAGQGQGRQQAKAQGLEVPMTAFGAADIDLFAMENAWLASVDAQIATANALVATGADEDEILGDDERAGVLRPAVIVAEGARWIASALTGAALAYWLWLLGRQGTPKSEWYHQAVAAIDERTTDCCLRVHGQVQPLETPFHLTGTPRYAEYLDHPPFHWYCRSAEAMLHRSQVGDQFSQEMQDAALAELAAREATGARVEIHPAHARSRR